MTFLYVISHPEGWRKIGRAVKPGRRLRQHQMHSGAVLKGEAIFRTDAPIEDEKSVLGQLAKFRVMGEWFAVDLQTTIDAVAQVTKAEPEPFPVPTARYKKRTRQPSTPIMLRVPPDLLDGVDRAAVKHSVASRPEAIRLILQDWFSQRGRL